MLKNRLKTPVHDKAVMDLPSAANSSLADPCFINDAVVYVYAPQKQVHRVESYLQAKKISYRLNDCTAPAESLKNHAVCYYQLPKMDKTLQDFVADRQCGAKATSLIDYLEDLLKYTPIELLDLDDVQSNKQHQNIGRSYTVLKRCMDVIGAVILLPFAVTICLFTALTIKVLTGGLVFYRVRVNGKHNAPITILKFNTSDLYGARPPLVMKSTVQSSLKSLIGKMIRYTELDALLYLINVVKGEMSLIGPRPARQELDVLIEQKNPHYRSRYQVKPGMTGYAQINNARAANSESSYDLYYVRHPSIGFDLKIIVKKMVRTIFGSPLNGYS
ncbi:sugar transferase [Endozoicomonas ascidiicola]|uniref:sugar transferase n=1 Tax=Endozoicomonas ascidiicola TaxID=1698521 RepID=UPI000AF7E55C|nr:sugar transferase [Endozoicomonas ascidiicola]